VASGQAQFGIDWLPSLLAARDKNTGPRENNSRQVFARSGMTQSAWKRQRHLDDREDEKARRSAKLASAATSTSLRRADQERAKWTPSTTRASRSFQQQFNMDAFIKRQIDSASANDLQRARSGSSKTKTSKTASSTRCPI